MKNAPFVSVIIPVYNDSERLRRCVQALEVQSYPPAAYEVIVVDNGSEEALDALLADFEHAEAAHEAAPGSYAARNSGIALARGDILAFTDSDCIPAPDWIERGVARLFSVPNCGLVGGRLEPQFADSAHPTAIELYEVIMYYPQKRFVEALHFSATANLFTYKRVFERVGVFDKDLKSSGDREWGRRVSSSGYALVYAEDVRVVHPVRNSFDQIRRKAIRLAGGYEDVRKNTASASAPTFWREAVLNVLPPVITVLRLDAQYPVALKEKVGIIGIWCLMKWIEAAERMKKKWGKTPSAR